MRLRLLPVIFCLLVGCADTPNDDENNKNTTSDESNQTDADNDTTIDPGTGPCPDFTECLEVVEAASVQYCPETSFGVTARNTCNFDVLIHLCIEKTSGEWDCGLEPSASPQRTLHYWTCRGTGEYVLRGHDVQSFGSDCIKPPDER